MNVFVVGLGFDVSEVSACFAPPWGLGSDVAWAEEDEEDMVEVCMGVIRCAVLIVYVREVEKHLEAALYKRLYGGSHERMRRAGLYDTTMTRTKMMTLL